MTEYKDKDAEFQDQRVSIKTKAKESWKVPNTNYIIDKAISSDGYNKELTTLFQRAARGHVDKDTYDYVMKGLSTKLGQDATKDIDKLYKNSRDIDFISPIKERYMGEFIRGFSKYNAINHNISFSDTIKKTLDAEFEDYIVQMFVNTVNAISEQEQMAAQQSENPAAEVNAPMNTGISSEELPDISIFMNEKRKEILNELTIKTNNMVEFVLSEVGAIDKYRKAYSNWFDTEEVITHKEVIGDKVILNIVNPKEYYRVDSGNRLIQDDKMGVRYYKMSIDDAIVKLNLSKYEVKKLRELVTFRETYFNSSTDMSERDISDAIRDSFGKSGYFFAYNPDGEGAEYNGFNKESFYDDSRIVDIYHVVWKGKTPYKELTYIDEFGDVQQIDVPYDYQLDYSKGDIEYETKYKDEAYENYRIGNDRRIALYTDPKPIDVPYESTRGLNKVKLPYNGIRGAIHNDYRNPIPYRMVPYLALYRIFTIQEERLIAKLINLAGIFPIGESLLTDSRHFKLRERITRAKKDGLLPYNDGDERNLASIQNLGVNNSSGSVYNLLNSLMELRANIKAEAWEAANMNESRFGDIDKYAGKSNTNESIRRVSMGSVLTTETFNIFRESEYEGLVHYAKYAHMDGISEIFIDSQDKKQVISYNQYEILNEDIGIKIVMNHKEQEKLEMFKEFAFNMSQNGDHAMASKAINSDNSTEIDKFIQESSKMAQEIEQRTESMKQEHEKFKMEYEASEKQKDRDNDLDEVSLKGEYDILVKLIELDQSNLESVGEASADKANDQNLKERELELKERIQRYSEVRDNIDAMLKEKDINSKERIAKMNKN